LTNEATASGRAALGRRIQMAADRIRTDTGSGAFSIHLSATTVPLESAADGDQLLECSLSCLDADPPAG
jgi:hypothetical protein